MRGFLNIDNQVKRFVEKIVGRLVKEWEIIGEHEVLVTLVLR